jgi:hypothetical protein
LIESLVLLLLVRRVWRCAGACGQNALFMSFLATHPEKLALLCVTKSCVLPLLLLLLLRRVW